MSNEAKDALKNVVGNMSPDEYNPDNATTTSSAPMPTSAPTPSPTPTTNGVDISNLPF